MLVGLCALVGNGVATAQQAEPPLGASPELSPPPTKLVTLSPDEQLSQAKGFVASIDAIRVNVESELQQARDKGDVVKTLCLDDKLKQLEKALQGASEREKALAAAVKASDAELSNHEYTILSVLNQRAIGLDAEAKLCIGKEVVSVGDSSSKMDVDGNLPGEDTTVSFPTSSLITEPPNCSSCFR
jgi:hypothetical protein